MLLPTQLLLSEFPAFLEAIPSPDQPLKTPAVLPRKALVLVFSTKTLTEAHYSSHFFQKDVTPFPNIEVFLPSFCG